MASVRDHSDALARHINTQLGLVFQILEKVEDQVGELRTTVGEVNTTVGQVNVKVTQLETRMGTVEAKTVAYDLLKARFVGIFATVTVMAAVWWYFFHEAIDAIFKHKP